MKFDFGCRACSTVTTVRSPVGKVPKTPYHHRRAMQRLYSPTKAHIRYDRAGYTERAYRGEESVPGMTAAQVRESIDSLPRAR